MQEYAGNIRCITFPNGTRKEIKPVVGDAGRSASVETVYFSNGPSTRLPSLLHGDACTRPYKLTTAPHVGDTKQAVSDGTVRYFYEGTGTVSDVPVPVGSRNAQCSIRQLIENGLCDRHK